MKHVTAAEKSLLTGDEATDLLIEYAALLAQIGSADRIELSAIGLDGDEVLATFLLNTGITILAESTTSSSPEPDDARAEQYLHTQIARLRGSGSSSPEDIAGASVWNAADPE